MYLSDVVHLHREAKSVIMRSRDTSDVITRETERDREREPISLYKLFREASLLANLLFAIIIPQCPSYSATCIFIFIFTFIFIFYTERFRSPNLSLPCSYLLGVGIPYVSLLLTRIYAVYRCNDRKERAAKCTWWWFMPSEL